MNISNILPFLLPQIVLKQQTSWPFFSFKLSLLPHQLTKLVYFLTPLCYSPSYNVMFLSRIELFLREYLSCPPLFFSTPWYMYTLSFFLLRLYPYTQPWKHGASQETRSQWALSNVTVKVSLDVVYCSKIFFINFRLVKLQVLAKLEVLSHVRISAHGLIDRVTSMWVPRRCRQDFRKVFVFWPYHPPPPQPPTKNLRWTLSYF